jgi:malonyl-ACP decarboxylase
LGVTTAIGQGIDAFGSALLNGSHAFGVMRRAGRQQDSAHLGAEIAPLRLSGAVSRHTLRAASFSAQVALATLDEACTDARLGEVDPERIGLIVGGSNLQQRESPLTQQETQSSFVRPTYALSFLDTDICGFCTAQFGIRGFAYTAGGACASGQLAIIEAARAVLSGEVDVCVAMGALMDLSHWECQALRTAGAMGSDRYATEPEYACRPFDAQRDGFIFGEGCAAVVLERPTSKPRGVRAYAFLTGWGLAADANRNPDPSRDGEIRAIRLALSKAGCQPADIDYINPHGSGSRLGDVTELEAIRGVGLDHARINATKSLVGHSLTAAGTVEVVATLLQMKAGQLHPTRNLDTPIDPNLNWVREHPEDHSIQHALTLSMGFGGINTALVFAACT